MVLTLADCDAMIDAAHLAGVQLLAGHTHSFDAPIRKMREIVGGSLGDVLMISTWNFNDFNARPWTTKELHGAFGPILNQAPHQVDVVPQLAGGMVESVRTETIPDALRGCEGGWALARVRWRRRSFTTRAASSTRPSSRGGWGGRLAARARH